MLQCWCSSSKGRPTFSELVQEHKRIITPTANDMDMLVTVTSEHVGVTIENIAAMDDEDTELRAKSRGKTSSSRPSLTDDMLQHGVLTDAGISIVLKPSSPDLDDVAEQ